MARMKKKQIQAVLDQLMWEHGIKVHETEAWPTLLQQHKIDPEHVTPALLEAAVNHTRKRLEDENRTHRPTPDNPTVGTLEWSIGVPEPRQDGSVYWRWKTTCGTYRITRVHIPSNGDYYYGVEYKDGDSWNYERAIGAVDNRPEHFNSLKQAILAAEVRQALQLQCKEITSNRDAIVDAAIEAGLDMTDNRILPTRGDTRHGLANRSPRKPKVAINKDRFGCLIGSQTAKINEGVSETEKRTAEEIAILCGVPTHKVRDHLKFWVKRGKMHCDGDLFWG